MKCTYNKRSGILLLQVVSLLFAYVAQVQAGISVQVFSRDEALSESNMSKPRIYIKNTGNVALNGVKFYYHFTTESGKTPVLERYYIPGFTVALITGTSGNYKLEYTLTSTLNAGAVVPGTDGSSIGLHYNTWSAWDKTNDFSNNQSAVFVENQNIPVYYLGTKIYGNEPGGNSTPPPGSPIADIRLNSFALYSTQQTIIKERSIFSGGGAVGSNVSVEIKENAVVHGNVVSGGNAKLWSNILIDGDITLGGTLIQQGTGNTFATLQENASVTTLTLPDYVVTTNTNNITVNQSQTVPLYPGIYGDLNVLQYGVLKLYPGNYTFKKFYIENDAKVVFMIGNYLDQIDISSSGEFDIQDRAELKFDTLSYAPSVKIYSRDPNTLRIGVDAKTAGIITAPLATVNMYTGARCDGAIYAKIINVEPDAIINSAYVDPNRDDDDDGVPTGIEIDPLIGTNPQDPTDYIPVAIPRDVIIDNTQTVTIIYSLQPFYTIYPESSSIVLVCPPGTLKDPSKAPILQFLNHPSDGSGISDTSTFRPIGMYLELVGNPIKNDSIIYFSIPAPEDALPFDYYMTVRNPVTNEWTPIIDPQLLISKLPQEDQDLLLSGGTGVGIFTGTNSLPPPAPPQKNGGNAIPGWKKTNQSVAYFDDGTVFSSYGSQISISLRIISKNTSCHKFSPGSVLIKYTDMASPSTELSKVILLQEDMPNDDNFIYYCYSTFKAPNNGFKINSVSVTLNDLLGQPYITEIRTLNLSATVGEMCKVNIYCNEEDLSSDEAFSFYKSTTMSFESQPLAGEGLIQQSGGDFNYSYFLKDHLGSTRMVLAENGEVKEALMYQPYGTVTPVDGIPGTGTDPLRQKFTQREYDDDGGCGCNTPPGANGINAYYLMARMYEPHIGKFLSVDPVSWGWDPYNYVGGNPILLSDPDGECPFCIPLAIIAISGAINVAANWKAIQASDASWQTGVGFFFVGATQSVATMYGGPFGALIGGAVAGMANAGLSGGSGSQIIMGGVAGLASSGIGMAVSGATAPLLSKLTLSFNGYSSPFIDGMIRGGIGGGIGGFVTGAAFGSFNANSMGDVWRSGLSGLQSGLATGMVTGATTSSLIALNDKRNPFNGAYSNKLSSKEKGWRGEERYVREIENKGGKVLGRHVYVKEPGGSRGSWASDVVWELKGKITLTEIKTGNSPLSPNQEIHIPLIKDAGAFYPVGQTGLNTFGTHQLQYININVEIIRYR